jgi:hypothetical protein
LTKGLGWTANSPLKKTEEEQEMRRVTLMLATMAVMMGLFATVAYAVTIAGTDEGEVILESNLDDTIFGRGGADRIRADVFGPKHGSPRDTDVARGNRGDDRIRIDDGDGRDTAIGGSGDDVCVGDPGDELDCETESQ